MNLRNLQKKTSKDNTEGNFVDKVKRYILKKAKALKKDSKSEYEEDGESFEEYCYDYSDTTDRDNCITITDDAGEVLCEFFIYENKLQITLFEEDKVATTLDDAIVAIDKAFESVENY